MLPNFVSVPVQKLPPLREVTKTAVLEVVSECAGFSGRVRPGRVWRELRDRGFRCSSKRAVSMMLHRCSGQGLLKKHKISRRRVFYSMLPSGLRRLRYKRMKGYSANVEKPKSTLFSEELRELMRVFAVKEVFKSSDLATEAFANFLLTLALTDGSYDQIGHYASLFLASRQMFPSNDRSSLTGNPDLVALSILLRVSDARNAFILQNTWGNPSTQTTYDEMMKEILSHQKECNRVLREALKQRLSKQSSTYSKDRSLSKQEPMNVGPVGTRGASKSYRSFKDDFKHVNMSALSSTDSDMKLYPASTVPVVISEMIRSAKSQILVQASHSCLSNSILAEMRNVSRRGLAVTLVTDKDCAVGKEYVEEWNIVEDSKAVSTLFIKDNFEALMVLAAETPESCVGIKFLLPVKQESMG